ncbi:MAG: TonB family protein [Pseudomonadota bacterium]
MIAPFPRSARILASAAVLGIITFGAHPAAAQSDNDEAVFVDLGRWTIFERPRARICELRLASGELVLSKVDRQPARLRLRARSSVRAPQGDIVWAFDDTRFAGQLYDRDTYAPSSDTAAVEELFRKAKFLTVRHDNQTVARISLKTSSAGFRLLKQCSEQWRFAPRLAQRQVERGPVAPSARTAAAQAAQQVATPPRPQPQTRPAARTPAARTPVADVTGPYPPNRALTPLNPGQWVRQDDFRRFNQSRFGNGTIRFTLQVDEAGRVEECIVNASSGSRDFDTATCKALEKRARFEPATDASGNATTATYSSRVKFAIGE